MKKIKKNVIRGLIYCLFSSCTSTAFAVTPIKPWLYTGGNTIPGGNVGVLNLASALGYTDNDFIHMAIQYINSPMPVTFQWSNLFVDLWGVIHPDPVTGYDGNIAYIAMDFSPAEWDGFSLNFNEFDNPCSGVHFSSSLDLITALATNPAVVVGTGSCQPPRNSLTGVSPNIAYAAIYLNINGASPLTPDIDKRRFLLMHETGHTFGLDHNSDACNSIGPSNSVMSKDSNPTVCNGVPTTLQTDDNNALSLRY